MRSAIARHAAILLGLLMASACKPDPYSQQKSQMIAKRFKAAVPVVEGFRRQHGRLPTDSELNEKMGLTKVSLTMMISKDGFSSCDRDLPQFRKAKEGSYVLAIWRGEWLECYDPVTRTSSL